MALTRKFLSALGIETEKIDEIITAHTETIDGLKEQRDQFKADSEKLAAVQKELDDTKKELGDLKEAAGKDGQNPYRKQYEDLKAEFDKYKEDQAAKDVLAKKTAAYKELLKEAGVSEKRIDSILKLKSADFDSFEIDDEGKIKTADELKKSIKEEWSDFIVQEGKQGANTQVPPTNQGGEPKPKSRAAQLANQYHTNIYGGATKDKEE